MKQLLPLLFLLPSLATAAPTIVGTPVALTSTSGSISISTSGDKLVVLYDGQGTASGAFTSITCDGGSTCTGGATISSDCAFTEVDDSTNGKHYYVASWSMAGITSGSHTVAVSATNQTLPRMYLAEVSGLGAIDSCAATKFSSSTSPVSNSITPAAANDLLLAGYLVTTAGVTFSALTNSFTSQASQNGASPSNMLAALVDSGTAAITSGATSSISDPWSVFMVAYKAAVSGGCTHNGLSPGGTTSVPTGVSGSYFLKNGSVGTPNCTSGTPYASPQLGNWTIN